MYLSFVSCSSFFSFFFYFFPFYCCLLCLVSIRWIYTWAKTERDLRKRVKTRVSHRDALLAPRRQAIRFLLLSLTSFRFWLTMESPCRITAGHNNTSHETGLIVGNSRKSPRAFPHPSSIFVQVVFFLSFFQSSQSFCSPYLSPSCTVEKRSPLQFLLLLDARREKRRLVRRRRNETEREIEWESSVWIS